MHQGACPTLGNASMPNSHSILSYSGTIMPLHHQHSFSTTIPVGNRRKCSCWVSSLLGLGAAMPEALGHSPSLMSGFGIFGLRLTRAIEPAGHYRVGLQELYSPLGHRNIGLPEPSCPLGQQIAGLSELLTCQGLITSRLTEAISTTR